MGTTTAPTTAMETGSKMAHTIQPLEWRWTATGMFRCWTGILGGIFRSKNRVRRLTADWVPQYSQVAVMASGPTDTPAPHLGQRTCKRRMT
jgi:hypothetical protein